MFVGGPEADLKAGFPVNASPSSDGRHGWDVWLRHTVIQHEINASVFQSRYVLPCGVLIVLENELFARVLGIPPNRLEVLDILRCHVGEKTKVLFRRSG